MVILCIDMRHKPGGTVQYQGKPDQIDVPEMTLWQMPAPQQSGDLDLESILCKFGDLVAVAKSSSVPPAVLAKLTESDDDWIKIAVAGNPACPGDALDHMLPGTPQVMTAIAGNPNARTDTLDRLVDNLDWGVYLGSLATNPHTSTAALATLLRQRDLESLDRAAVLRHPHCAVGILYEYGRSAFPIFRAAVAANPTCPSELLVELVQDGYMQTRVEVAANRNTPMEILIELVADPESPVCRAVFANPHCPEYIKAIVILAHD